jgi:hypothetical protein
VSDERYRTASAIPRGIRVVGALVATAIIVAGLLSGLLSMKALETARRPSQSGAVMHYTGEFRYQAGSSPSWCAVEIVKLKKSVLDRVMRTTRGTVASAGAPAGPAQSCSSAGGKASGDTPATKHRSPVNGPAAQTNPRLSLTLGRQWQYEGMLGIEEPLHVYRRFRTLPVRLPPDDRTVSVVNQVALPLIDLDQFRLIPDDRSTMRFEGPSRVLRATSPNAEAEHFAGQVAYTVPLRELVRDPRIEIGSPTGPSLGERLISGMLAFAVSWFTSLIGLIVTTVVTVVTTVVISRWLR